MACIFCMVVEAVLRSCLKITFALKSATWTIPFYSCATSASFVSNTLERGHYRVAVNKCEVLLIAEGAQVHDVHVQVTDFKLRLEIC